MWVFDSTLATIALRTAIIYVIILVGIRLTGKREVGQMTPFDLVLLLLIANAVQNAMTGPDTSVTGGLVAAVTLLALNKATGYIVWKNHTARRVVEGIPTLLIRDGKILQVNLDRERMRREDLEQSLREHGVETVEEVHLAMLEIDGSISVLKHDDVSKEMKPHRRIRLLRHH